MSNAVYLIVAGVLLGPIEAQTLHNDQYLMVRETPVQVCERAMKEIGAVAIGPHAKEGWIGTLGELREIDRIRCIPAPSGMVKR